MKQPTFTWAWVFVGFLFVVSIGLGIYGLTNWDIAAMVGSVAMLLIGFLNYHTIENMEA